MSVDLVYETFQSVDNTPKLRYTFSALIKGLCKYLVLGQPASDKHKVISLGSLRSPKLVWASPVQSLLHPVLYSNLPSPEKIYSSLVFFLILSY